MVALLRLLPLPHELFILGDLGLRRQGQEGTLDSASGYVMFVLRLRSAGGLRWEKPVWSLPVIVKTPESLINIHAAPNYSPFLKG